MPEWPDVPDVARLARQGPIITRTEAKYRYFRIPGQRPLPDPGLLTHCPVSGVDSAWLFPCGSDVYALQAPLNLHNPDTVYKAK